jgi:hypothetical protein
MWTQFTILEISLTEIDADVEAQIRPTNREIVIWTGPSGRAKAIRNLPLPVKAQALIFRISLVTERQELDAR